MSNEDVLSLNLLRKQRETITVDGVEYPVVKLEISRTSHPFTQENKLIDTAGRIDKFKTNTLSTLNNYSFFNIIKPRLQRGFFILFI
jgi:large subunit ribosomal protein L31